LAFDLFRLLEAVLEEPEVGIDYPADDGLSKRIQAVDLQSLGLSLFIADADAAFRTPGHRNLEAILRSSQCIRAAWDSLVLAQLSVAQLFCFLFAQAAALSGAFGCRRKTISQLSRFIFAARNHLAGAGTVSELFGFLFRQALAASRAGLITSSYGDQRKRCQQH
jgi:hypothetical protein